MPYKPTPSLRSLVTVATTDEDVLLDLKHPIEAQQPPPIPARRQLFNRVAQRASASSGTSSTSSGSSIAIANFRHPESACVTFGRAKMRHPRNGCVYVNLPKERAAANGTIYGQETVDCGGNPFEDDDDGDDGSDDVDSRPAFQAFTRNDAQFARLRQRVNRIQHRISHAQSLAQLPTTASTEAIIHRDNRITIHVRYGAEEVAAGLRNRHRPLSPAYSAQSSRRSSTVSSSASSARQPDPEANKDDDGTGPGTGQVFAERAIDVPADFERNAYAKKPARPDRQLSPSSHRKLIPAQRQLSPSLQDFLQNDWVYVDDIASVDDIHEVGTQSSVPFWPSWQEFMQNGWVYVDEVNNGEVYSIVGSDEDWIDLDEQFEDDHIPNHHPVTGRRTSIRSQSGLPDSAIMKSVKNQLRKQAQRFKLSRLRKNLSTSTPILRVEEGPEILLVRPARHSTNPFEDCDEEADEADRTASVAAARHQQLEQLLQRIAPYCYSVDPLAPHRFHRPQLTGHRSTSILTRSLEVNNPEKCQIVDEFLRGELQPRALLTRRFWSQSDVQDGQRRHPVGPAPHHRRSLGVSSLAAKSRQMCHSLQNALQRTNRSLSETNLSNGQAAWGRGTTSDYCPGGVYQSRRRAVGKKGQQQPQSQTLRGRWKLWTTQLRRSRHRVGDAGGHGDT